MVVDPGHEADVFVAVGAAGDEARSRSLLAEPAPFARPHACREHPIARIRVRGENEIETMAGERRPARHYRLRLLRTVAGKHGYVVDRDELVDPFDALEERRHRRTAEPGDPDRVFLRAQRGDHRKRHDDVSDRGQLDDENGARHGRSKEAAEPGRGVDAHAPGSVPDEF